jgi:hypothetical protein
LGQVTPACPSFLTSDSLMPLQIQMYIKLFFDNDNSFQFKLIIASIRETVKNSMI